MGVGGWQTEVAGVVECGGVGHLAEWGMAEGRGASTRAEPELRGEAGREGDEGGMGTGRGKEWKR